MLGGTLPVSVGCKIWLPAFEQSQQTFILDPGGDKVPIRKESGQTTGGQDVRCFEFERIHRHAIADVRLVSASR